MRVRISGNFVLELVDNLTYIWSDTARNVFLDREPVINIVIAFTATAHCAMGFSGNSVLSSSTAMEFHPSHLLRTLLHAS